MIVQLSGVVYTERSRNEEWNYTFSQKKKCRTWWGNWTNTSDYLN